MGCIHTLICTHRHTHIKNTPTHYTHPHTHTKTSTNSSQKTTLQQKKHTQNTHLRTHHYACMHSHQIIQASQPPPSSPLSPLPHSSLLSREVHTVLSFSLYLYHIFFSFKASVFKQSIGIKKDLKQKQKCANCLPLPPPQSLSLFSFFIPLASSCLCSHLLNLVKSPWIVPCASEKRVG